MALQPSGLSPIESRAWRLIEEAPAPGKHCARSAVFHLERAARIKDIDPTMAMFRAITAEEEAATAVFHALQRRRYPNASLIKWRDHKHKAALLPFLEAATGIIQHSAFLEPQLLFEEHAGQDQLRLRVKVPKPDGGFLFVYPDPPLDFNFEVNGKLHDFQPELAGLLERASVRRFADFVEARANERNRLLYASTQGVPHVEGDIDKALSNRRQTVFSVLAVFLLIDSVSKHQQFVVQTLNAFLKVVGLIPEPEAAA
jgi:hypothetical protein